MGSDYFHSVILKEDRCIGCTSCLRVCPTEAIRLRDGKARIIGQRCIDCGECIRICPNHAKSAVTDKLDIINRFKYTIAIPSMVLYGQFGENVGINQILNAIKSLGFDEVCEVSKGTEILSRVVKSHLIQKNDTGRPLINSACPAILRLIQIRFPDLLSCVIDIETPMEIAARMAKVDAAKRTGLPMEDIGAIFISPCTARVTSIRNPLGIEKSYIDGAVSMKDIYGELVRRITSNPGENLVTSTREAVLWPLIGGQADALGIDNSLSVDGINEVMKVLEEIDMDKLEGLDFFEGMACIGGCVGGPLTIENSFIARKKIKALAKKLPDAAYSEEEIKEFIRMYEDGFIRLTDPIPPRSIMKLDNDLGKSMQKMEMIKEILKYLPGLDCGACGSPSCRTFAEDIVKGENHSSICVVKTMENLRIKNNG